MKNSYLTCTCNCGYINPQTETEAFCEACDYWELYELDAVYSEEQEIEAAE
jgi:predicted nucleic-acid-binding Zn-ribbon protein